MYKKILVPLDGSGRAEKILPHVEALALCTGASVILMEVVEPMPVIVDAQESMIMIQLDEMQCREDDARSYLTMRVEEFRHKGIQASLRLLHGPVAQAICSVAETDDVDLIAMASHGRGGLARVVYGSVAAAVLQRVDRPLLLIRAAEADDN